MTTTLGPKGSIRLHGVNVGSTTISKGCAGAMVPGNTTAYLPDSIQDDTVPVQLFSAANDHFYGVAVDDVPPGQMGEFVVLGFARVKSGAAIASGAGLEPLNADGRFDDAGGGLAGNAEVGLSLEAANGADELIKAFINALGWDGGMGGA